MVWCGLQPRISGVLQLSKSVSLLDAALIDWRVCELLGRYGAVVWTLVWDIMGAECCRVSLGSCQPWRWQVGDFCGR